MNSLALRYPSGIGVLRGVRSHRCFGREAMRQTFAQDDEDAILDWLEAALEHAYSHSQSKTLAYLEAVVEDMVFEKQVSVGEASAVG